MHPGHGPTRHLTPGELPRILGVDRWGESVAAVGGRQAPSHDMLAVDFAKRRVKVMKAAGARLDRGPMKLTPSESDEPHYIGAGDGNRTRVLSLGS